MNDVFLRLVKETRFMTDSQFQKWLEALNDNELKFVVAFSRYINENSEDILKKRNHDYIQSLISIEIPICPDGWDYERWNKDFQEWNFWLRGDKNE